MPPILCLSIGLGVGRGVDLGLGLSLCVLLALAACSAASGPYASAVSVTVAGVRIDPQSASPVILLREDEGRRRHLPIWIGTHEARSIALAMEQITLPRPNSHDLIRNILHGVDALISRVIITELRNGTYYAVLEVEIDGRLAEIDARPSDAIAVAMRVKAPIFAAQEVLDEAGLMQRSGEALEIDWSSHREVRPDSGAH